MIDNLKKIMNEMSGKSVFIESVADYYNCSYDYIIRRWFQNKWLIPEDKLPKIIEMAQKELFHQTEVKRKTLIETGYEITGK